MPSGKPQALPLPEVSDLVQAICSLEALASPCHRLQNANTLIGPQTPG